MQVATRGASSDFPSLFRQLDENGHLAPQRPFKSARLVLQRQLPPFDNPDLPGAQQLDSSSSGSSSSLEVGGFSSSPVAELQRQLEVLGQCSTPSSSSHAPARLSPPVAAADAAKQYDAAVAALNAGGSANLLQAAVQQLNKGDSLVSSNLQQQQQVAGPLTQEQWQQEQEQRYRKQQQKGVPTKQQQKVQQQVGEVSAYIAALEKGVANITASGSSSSSSSSGFVSEVGAIISSSSGSTSMMAAPTSSSSSGSSLESVNEATGAAAASMPQLLTGAAFVSSSSQLRMKDKGAEPSRKEAFDRSLSQSQEAGQDLLGARPGPSAGILTIELPPEVFKRKQEVVLSQLQQQKEQRHEQQIEQRGEQQRELEQEQQVLTQLMEQERQQREAGVQILRTYAEGMIQEQQQLQGRLQQYENQQQQQQHVGVAQKPSAGDFAPALLDVLAQTGKEHLPVQQVLQEEIWRYSCHFFVALLGVRK